MSPGGSAAAGITFPGPSAAAFAAALDISASVAEGSRAAAPAAATDPERKRLRFMVKSFLAV
jgi:hypothetical protein